MLPLLASLLALSQAADTMAIHAGRILNLQTGRYENDVTLLVSDGKIVARGRGLPVSSAVSAIDVTGMTILPGLIDAHVHLTIAGRPRENAERTLRAGFTTVADLGAANGAGVRLKRLIEADSVVGPTMIAGGSWIGGRGGVCEFGRATIRGAVEAGARAEADLAAGADLLKLCVSGWINDAAAYPDSVELSDDEMAAVMVPARAAGKPMAAHATSAAAVRHSLKAGVRLFAHTPIVNEAEANDLAKNGACVATTMTTLLGSDSSAALRQSFIRLRAAGVKLMLGTDAGVLPHGSNAEEAVTLGSLGMTSLEVIRSATTIAGDCLGLVSYGTLAPGTDADMVAVIGDPLENLDVLKSPALVIRRGIVFRPGSPPETSGGRSNRQ